MFFWLFIKYFITVLVFKPLPGFLEPEASLISTGDQYRGVRWPSGILWWLAADPGGSAAMISWSVGSNIPLSPWHQHRFPSRWTLLLLLFGSFQGYLASPRCCLHLITGCRNMGEHFCVCSSSLGCQSRPMGKRQDWHLHTYTHTNTRQMHAHHMEAPTDRCLWAFTAHWVWI